ncbi:MAG: DUF835 domain-containing protein [Thermoplasmatota archaeon]
MNLTKSFIKVFTVAFFIMILSPFTTVFVGGDDVGETGSVECNTNHQLIPISGDVGGGNVHWKLKGDAARQFRKALIDSVGNDTLYPDTANGDEILDQAELQLYLDQVGMLESYLQRGGELSSYRNGGKSYKYQHAEGVFRPRREIDPTERIDYYGVSITRSSLDTDSLSDDTSGLLGSRPDDSSDIDIHYTIAFESGPGSKEYELNLADHRVPTVLWDCFIIPVQRTIIDNATSSQISSTIDSDIQLRHSDILVSEGEVQGIVLKNNVPMDENNYSFDVDESTLNINSGIDEGDNITVVYAYGLNWQGETKQTHWSYIVGLNSFYGPDHDEGSLYVVRTPAGEVLYYSTEYQDKDTPQATILWDNLQIFENPQILFVFVVIASYFISLFPKKHFREYRDEYPIRYQSRAEKNRMVHLLKGVFVVALFLLYFFPAFGGFFMKGIYLMLLGGGMLFVEYILSKMIYDKKKSQIPDSIKNAPEKKRRKPRTKNRTKTITRVKTRRPAATSTTTTRKKSNDNVKRVYCDTCGEFFTVHKKRNLLTVKCPKCDSRMRMLREGYNYLLLEDEGNETYSVFSKFVEEGAKGMVITTNLPEKVEEKYGIRNSKIMWISDHSSERYSVLNPQRLDFEITRAIKNFADENERAVILLDGLEYLVVENGFEKVSKFIKKATDMVSVNASTLLVHVNPNSFAKSELSILKKEFDNCEDLALPDKEDKKSVY